MLRSGIESSPLALNERGTLSPGQPHSAYPCSAPGEWGAWTSRPQGSGAQGEQGGILAIPAPGPQCPWLDQGFKPGCPCYSRANARMGPSVQPAVAQGSRRPRRISPRIPMKLCSWGGFPTPVPPESPTPPRGAQTATPTAAPLCSTQTGYRCGWNPGVILVGLGASCRASAWPLEPRRGISIAGQPLEPPACRICSTPGSDERSWRPPNPNGGPTLAPQTARPSSLSYMLGPWVVLAVLNPPRIPTRGQLEPRTARPTGLSYMRSV